MRETEREGECESVPTTQRIGAGRTRVGDDGRGSVHGPISLGPTPRCDGLIYRIAVSVD